MGSEPGGNEVVVPACQAPYTVKKVRDFPAPSWDVTNLFTVKACGIDSLESLSVLLKSLKIPSQVLSGEIKGKALAKVNQQAFEEYNDSALVPCPYCARYTQKYSTTARSSFNNSIF